jgi:membrane associated rhomboid family serine protease
MPLTRAARSASPATVSARGALTRELRRDARIVGGALALAWGTLVANAALFGGALASFGIVPRTLVGLRGILAAPFLHANAAHLVANSVGFVLLGGLVLLRRPRDFWRVTAAGVVLGGLGTWLLGARGVHLGASGVVFAYLGYLLTTGLFERKPGAILLSLVAASTWGGLVLGMLPGAAGMSWEGHLSGFVAGIVAARAIARDRRRSGR